MIKNVVPVITSSPWNPVAIKNFDPYADSAIFEWCCNLLQTKRNLLYMRH